jgi:hypothetical protein
MAATSSSVAPSCCCIPAVAIEVSCCQTSSEVASAMVAPATGASTTGTSTTMATSVTFAAVAVQIAFAGATTAFKAMGLQIGWSSEVPSFYSSSVEQLCS